MVEVSMSFNYNSERHIARIRPLLEAFQAKTGIHVAINSAQSTRNELVRLALYPHGPDVSEISSTWTNDFIAMNTLRPFSETELATIGKPEDFPRGAWDTCHRALEKQAWAIPCMMEAVIIHYRKDLLAQAGVDETKAFCSLGSLAEAARALQETGVPVPVETPYRWAGYNQLHALSGWIWSYGGDYLSADGKQLLFDQPSALQAMVDYFSLARFSSPEGIQRVQETKNSLFRQGQSAILFFPQFHRIPMDEVPPQVLEAWSAASYPGEGYIGGSNLIIWKKAVYDQAALELVRFLTSSRVETGFLHDTQELPTRLAAHADPEIRQDPVFRATAEAANGGRTYPGVPLWGSIEERLIQACDLIQTSLYQNPARSVEEIVHAAILPLAKKLRLTLSQ